MLGVWSGEATLSRTFRDPDAPKTSRASLVPPKGQEERASFVWIIPSVPHFLLDIASLTALRSLRSTVLLLVYLRAPSFISSRCCTCPLRILIRRRHASSIEIASVTTIPSGDPFSLFRAARPRARTVHERDREEMQPSDRVT